MIVQVLGVSPNVRRVLEGIAKSQFPRGFQKWRPTSEAFYFRLPAYNDTTPSNSDESRRFWIYPLERGFAIFFL